ncbi:hypothetical protein Y1Q_0018283 [Alligator mississippiensis]|uniref:Uncharacterized protein n=1 Tax=Alligator mississippiensis TaxID=8496 RepID=A0A151PBQ6_ALLMI|nr:hypothetical protein Y1Q_0018283 [Alligator mississippiensis]
MTFLLRSLPSVTTRASQRDGQGVLALPPAQCQSCLHQSWSCCHYVPQAETTPCSRLDPAPKQKETEE